MNTQHMIQRTGYLLVAGLFLTACLFASSPAFAGPAGRKHPPQRHETHHSGVVAKMHGGHNRPYFRSARRHSSPRGPFLHRNRPRVSLFVGAPIGAFFSTLPVGYTRVVVHGSSYYAAGGVYYQQAVGGYRVVEAPREVVVITSPPVQRTLPAVLPEEVQVSAAALNVRTGPGLHYSAIGRVQRGDTLRVINSAPGWLNVQMESGQSGWVMDSFTVPVSGPASG